jgi:hypothetical protein
MTLAPRASSPTLHTETIVNTTLGDAMRRSIAAVAILLIACLPAASHAQRGGGTIALPNTTPPHEAGQFDFLAGEWSLAAVQRYPGLAGMIHGGPKMTGTWKARRAFDGFGVEDELRLYDTSGNPVLFASAARVFDAADHRWTVSSLDVYRGRFSPSSAEWQDGKMVVTTQPTGEAGKTSMTRLRFFDIKPSSFKAWQDRSNDGGKTWEEGRLRIDAKRTKP